MKIIIIFFIFTIFLILILKLVAHLVREQFCLSREELSAYECGFEHHNVSRVPISLRYFLLTLLFLLFDLEIVFLLFIPTICLSSSVYLILVTRFLFVCFLYLTLFYE